MWPLFYALFIGWTGGGEVGANRADMAPPQTKEKNLKERLQPTLDRANEEVKKYRLQGASELACVGVRTAGVC